MISTPVAVTIVINLAAGASGCLLSLTISYYVWRFFSPAAGRTAAFSSRLVPLPAFHDMIGQAELGDLMAATGGFHPDLIVVAGSAKFGTSYRAALPGKSVLTVKRLPELSLWEDQFRSEMGRLIQIRHPNLAPLLGYSSLGEDRLLVYKNMSRGALSSRLRSGDRNLDWPTRLMIGIGAARALAWLHHGFPVPVLHRSLSSSAVLLDEGYEPRIADFGLARLVRQPPPSNADDPLPSTKEDVYEFGVILLELATGEVNDHGEVAERRLRLCVVDESLRGKGHDDQIAEFLNVACFCVLPCPQQRPSMDEVHRSLRMINGGREPLATSDEPSRVRGRGKLEAAELVKLAYCSYTGTNPFV